MWIVCLADNSHEMSSFIFSEKKKKKKKFKVSSAADAISAYMVNLFETINP